jgi:predicted ATPase
MQEAVRRHDALMRSAIEAHGGYVFKTIGDAFCAAFAKAPDAVEATLQAQRSFTSEDFSAVEGIRVRMALHTGDADERDGDYFGPTLNRVARLLSVGHGGQVLLSGVTSEIVRSSLPADVELRDLGMHQLKNLAHREHVFALLGPGLLGEFPPLRSVATTRNNLPEPMSALIGRIEDADAIKSLLQRSRLVTIIGAGGIGKTRVALSVAASLVEAYPAGVWFVNLAPLQNPDLVADEIASVLGLHQSAERAVLEILVEYLKKRHLLLIVDNCEHLIAEVSRICEAIVRQCAQIDVLATSREPLGIESERSYRLPSLDTPPVGALSTAKTALGFASVALFVERATAVNPGFVLTDRNAGVVSDVCRRLDGIALAIELAAARVNVLALNQIRGGLDQRFHILTEGRRTALPRQQTMRATIDWSHDLLSEKERLLFRRLAIFAGGWTLEAAEATCAFGSLEKPDVLDVLSSLVRKSLVAVDFGETDARYRLLESTRAYASEMAQTEAADLSERHAAWVMAFVQETSDLEWTMPQQPWLARIEAEIDNIRLALGWASRAGGRPCILPRIVGQLGAFWNDAGLRAEGRRWLDVAVASIDEQTDPLDAGRLWRAVATNSMARRAVSAGRNAIELLERADDRRELAAGCAALAFGLWQVGDLSGAALVAERASLLFTAAGLHESRVRADAVDTRANILRAVGENREARALFAEALAILTKLDDEWGAASIRGNLAELEFAAGNTDRAIELVQGAATVFRSFGVPSREAIALVNAATYQLDRGDIDDAHNAALIGLDLARRADDKPVVAVALQNLAAVSALRGDARAAARLIGYVDEWFRAEGYERDASERRISELVAKTLSARLSESEVQELLTAGAELSEEQAAKELALGLSTYP